MDKTLSLSTLWRKGHFPHLRDFFATATKCGFNQFYLDQTISLSEIADFSLPEGQISVIEIPCPAHPRNAEAQFSSLDRYEKEAARKAATSSFEFAFDVKAPVLVVHLGRVDISPKLESALYNAFRLEGAESQIFQSLQKELIDTRARNAPLHLKSALYDVEYLANRALEFDLKLAIVTPNHYSGLPLPEEAHLIIENFGDPVFYWHDAGNAHLFDKFGLMPSASWLEAAADNLLGLHLHDVQGLKCGLPPQEESELDFASLAATLSSSIYLNCKFAPTANMEEITQGRVKFNDIFNSKKIA